MKLALSCGPALLRAAPMLAIALTLVACSGDHAPQQAEPASVALPVVLAVSTTDSALGDLASGTITADQRVQLASRAAGTVRMAGLYEGQRVRAGQLLAIVDAQQATDAARQSRAALLAAQAEQRQADAEVARNEPLARVGAVALTQFEQHQLRARTAAAAVEQARAALAIADTNRRDQRVTSPVHGVVVTRHARDGDIVQPGTVLVTVEGRGHLLFRFAAPQASLPAFAPGTRVPVLIDGRDGPPAEGTVRAIVPSADPATRRYTVEISLPPDDRLYPGMFGRVRLPAAGTQGREVVSVPAAALVERGGLPGVFVVNQDGRVYFRWLRLTERIEDQVIVVAGLDAGERVLAQVTPAVRDGMRLQPPEPAR